MDIDVRAMTGYFQSPEEKEFSDDIPTTVPPVSHSRPNIVRRDSDHILSYYQSELAGQSYAYASNDPPEPRLRESVSSFQYAPDTQLQLVDAPAPLDNEGQHNPTAEYKHARRPSALTARGTDRRRLAIVELATPPLSIHRKRSAQGDLASIHTTLLSRRGLHVNGLALVAPPDASPSSYTDLTPPTSAPISSGRSHSVLYSAHQRSASEAISPTGSSLRRTPRDVGIVGFGRGSVSSPTDSLGPVSPDDNSHSSSLEVPIFQTPSKSRSPSPAPGVSDFSDSYPRVNHTLMATEHEERVVLLTPEIGQAKDIKQPVVGPVVVELGAHSVMSRKPSRPNVNVVMPVMSAPSPPPSPYSAQPQSAYIYYQPGVHATAGPLPSPPKAFDTADRASPPPRPPRHTPLSAAARQELEAIKASLQLPKSISAALDARPKFVDGFNAQTSSSLGSGQSTNVEGSTSAEANVQRTPSRSHHTREGAFPPSTLINSNDLSAAAAEIHTESIQGFTGAKTSEQAIPQDEARRPVTDIGMKQLNEDASSSRSSGSSSSSHYVSLSRQGSWVSLGKKASRRSSSNGGPQPQPKSAASVSSSSDTTSPPPPPTKTRVSEDERMHGGLNTLKATFSTFKRFSSLPRTPSLSSLGRSSGHSTPRSSTSRDHSPSLARRISSPGLTQLTSPIAVVSLAPKPFEAALATPRIRRRLSPRLRIKAMWPDAMHCTEITAKRSALERSLGYAQKINELAMYDCGLSDWVMSMKHRGAVMHRTRTNVKRSTITPSLPSSMTLVEQPRQTSHGSTASEATFPVRPDAYSATDLTLRLTDDIQSAFSPPPSLPYPSLAKNVRAPPMRGVTTSFPPPTAHRTLPLLSSKSASTGFFSSIGRKNSVKNDHGAVSLPSPSKLLSKRHHLPLKGHSPPREVVITGTPSVPGGPRAVPGRIQRAQTVSMTPKNTMSDHVRAPSTGGALNRTSVGPRRPSFFHRTAGSVSPGTNPPSAMATSPEFERQVDKLADLLPHADRDVLAGYLRRAGQDILAIGQYLEDEKNGRLRRD